MADNKGVKVAMKKMKRILLIGYIALLGMVLSACNGAALDSMINKENGVESGTIELGDDLYSFTIKINGVIYSLPIPFSELVENGWIAEDIEEEELLPERRSSYFSVHNQEGYSFRAQFINNTLDVISLEESEVMTIDTSSFHGFEDADFVLPGGITKDSSREDIIEAYGKPTEQWERPMGNFIQYGRQGGSSVRFKFDLRTDELLAILIMNDRRREVSPEFQGEIPDIIHDYVAPYELGEDWQTFNVKIDEELFRLPAPVMAFIDKGWEIVEDPNEIVAAHSMIGNVSLRRNNQFIRVRVHNYANTAQPIIHTFVTVVHQSVGDSFRMELPSGITNESTIEEVIATFGEPVHRSELSLSIKYTFGERRRGPAEINIRISNEDQRITYISIKNHPQTLEFE